MEIGAEIGNYRITSLLGEGGMGMVYVAEHPLIGKKVALKVLRRELAVDPEAVARFFTEARAVVKVGHENIVDISDFGRTTDGECYFIMELLAGLPLSKCLEQVGRLPWPEALHICTQVASALNAAHAQKVLHRDLKPDNIFLITRGEDPNFVKVLDFGLAKLSDEAGAGPRTKSGMVMGTPYYMSPEQCEGVSDIDARTDIYALGVILYQCLTGNVPFTGQTFAQILVKHLTLEPAPPRTLQPSLPPEIDALVLRAMVKDRAQRFQTMAEIRDAMRRLLHAQAPSMGTAPTMAAPTPSTATGGASMATPGLPGPSPTTLGSAAIASMPPAPSTLGRSRSKALAAAAAGGALIAGVAILAGLRSSRTAPSGHALAAPALAEPAPAGQPLRPLASTPPAPPAPAAPRAAISPRHAVAPAAPSAASPEPAPANSPAQAAEAPRPIAGHAPAAVPARAKTVVRASPPRRAKTAPPDQPAETAPPRSLDPTNGLVPPSF